MTIADYNLSRTSDGQWVCVDFAHGITCAWEDQEFNETQKYSANAPVTDPLKLATYAREMTDWLVHYHADKVTPAPTTVVAQCARARIGDQLRVAREEAGLSLSEVGELTGLSKNHIHRVETGRYNATIDTIAIIATALGCDVNITDNIC